MAIVQSHLRYLFTSETWKISERGVMLWEHEICSHVCRLACYLACGTLCDVSHFQRQGQWNTKNIYFFSIRCASLISDSNDIIVQSS